jgi:formate/nitrite transporter FocA (FNT family)
MAEIFGFDAYSPKEIAEQVEKIGVAKARLPLLSMMGLGVLAGGFIGLGALYSTLITSDPNLSFGISRLLGGLAFSLGLILVGGEVDAWERPRPRCGFRAGRYCPVRRSY